MKLITCRSCLNWTPPAEPERGFAGHCKTDAWKSSWTPGKGYALTPYADDERECAQHVQMPVVMPGYVARKTA